MNEAVWGFYDKAYCFRLQLVTWFLRCRLRGMTGKGVDCVVVILQIQVRLRHAQPDNQCVTLASRTTGHSLCSSLSLCPCGSKKLAPLRTFAPSRLCGPNIHPPKPYVYRKDSFPA